MEEQRAKIDKLEKQLSNLKNRKDISIDGAIKLMRENETKIKKYKKDIEFLKKDLLD